MKQLESGKDNRSTPIYAIVIPDTSYQAYSQQLIEGSVAVPADARWAIFNASHNYFISESSFTLPILGATSNEALRMNPEVVDVREITTIYYQTTEDAYINIEFYR